MVQALRAEGFALRADRAALGVQQLLDVAGCDAVEALLGEGGVHEVSDDHALGLLVGGLPLAEVLEPPDERLAQRGRLGWRNVETVAVALFAPLEIVGVALRLGLRPGRRGLVEPSAMAVLVA